MLPDRLDSWGPVLARRRVLCAVIAASANAWVLLLVEIVRDERYGPPAEPSGEAAPDRPGDQSS